VQVLLGCCSGGAGVLAGMHVSAPLGFPHPSGPARPVVVGHRGAPAYRPEHTRESYELAIDLGADMIEPDVLVSRDGALVVRHESALSLTTDVARHPEFADRRRPGLLQGRRVLDWFVDDFDLAELRTLRAVERMPGLRPLNTAYDGRSGILTLAEVLEIARARSDARRTVRVLVELAPGPTRRGTEVAGLVAAELRRLGVAHGGAPVVLQSFEPAALRRLRAELGDGPAMVQLIDDFPSFDAMTTPSGLREISTYAQGIGPSRDRVLLRDEDGIEVRYGGLVDRAHDAALAVHVWRLNPENALLLPPFRRGMSPTVHGDPVGEARALLDLGVDGLITDAPETAVRARDEVGALV
jgi:glycerophosphoryl diester phosphodiesterase